MKYFEITEYLLLPSCRESFTECEMLSGCSVVNEYPENHLQLRCVEAETIKKLLILNTDIQAVQCFFRPHFKLFYIVFAGLSGMKDAPAACLPPATNFIHTESWKLFLYTTILVTKLLSLLQHGNPDRKLGNPA